MERVGHRIREMRDERKWSQAKLAEEAGISENYISDIENNARPGASLGMYKKIADALGISLPQLLLDNDVSDVLDSIILLLADRPLDVQENVLELIEVYLKGLDRLQR
ncbi:helix-turn-helix domain-containing protein [Bacillus timonensis]|uniref:helix-turn-helix domain-containing protein n=1 Tax=Bacillus timonensis TaxID=1033734 RepID=UPI0002883B49|nr:helix-turn-helix transcriptional regulator [Bacillus timonensis]